MQFLKGCLRGCGDPRIVTLLLFTAVLTLYWFVKYRSRQEEAGEIPFVEMRFVVCGRFAGKQESAMRWPQIQGAQLLPKLVGTMPGMALDSPECRRLGSIGNVPQPVRTRQFTDMKFNLSLRILVGNIALLSSLNLQGQTTQEEISRTFDESSVVVVHDSPGNHGDGVDELWRCVPGVQGQALEFDGFIAA